MAGIAVKLERLRAAAEAARVMATFSCGGRRQFINEFAAPDAVYVKGDTHGSI